MGAFLRRDGVIRWVTIPSPPPLLPERCLEQLRQVDEQRRHGSVRLPLEPVADHLRPLVFRTPSLHEPRIAVNYPVFRNSFTLIPAPLHGTIGMCCAWRQYLDYKQESTYVRP